MQDKTNIGNVIRHVVNDHNSTGRLDEPFYVVDVEDIIEKYRKLLKYMPRVKQYFAVKSNPSPIVLEILAGLGMSFDCASRGEIEAVLKLGVSPDRIIYAHPVKARSHIAYAAQVGVKEMTFDNEDELHKVQKLHPGADMVLRIAVNTEKYSKLPLTKKFGANLQQVRHLLLVARKLGVNLCQLGEAYTKAICDAKYVFDQGKELGFNMHLLDIGGGFSGTITALNKTPDQMARIVHNALELYFPANTTINLTIISEFGRYYGVVHKVHAHFPYN
ncbi:unnamed protein product, partial [Oppiella nova]